MNKLGNLPPKPLVSIITPTFNSGKYLEECIKSILDQDYSRIEHILQDGASTDNTKKILKKYQAPKYRNKIRIYSEPDNGQIDGLNKAIQKAKGDILLVLNADDMLMPFAVSWGVENLKKYPEVGVVYGDVYIINEKSEIYDIYKAHEYSFEELLSVELVPPAQAAFIRREALEKVGFYADTSIETCPDYEMWIRIAQKFPMKHVWGVVTKYRRHDTPQLDSKRKRTVERFVDAKRTVMDRLLKNPKTPKKIRKLTRRAYAGLDYWAYRSAIDLGQAIMAYFYIWRSFLRYPNIGTFGVILKITRIFSYYALQRVVKLFRRSSYAISKHLS